MINGKNSESDMKLNLVINEKKRPNDFQCDLESNIFKVVGKIWGLDNLTKIGNSEAEKIWDILVRLGIGNVNSK